MLTCVSHLYHNKHIFVTKNDNFLSLKSLMDHCLEVMEGRGLQGQMLAMVVRGKSQWETQHAIWNVSNAHSSQGNNV